MLGDKSNYSPLFFFYQIVGLYLRIKQKIERKRVMTKHLFSPRRIQLMVTNKTLQINILKFYHKVK